MYFLSMVTVKLEQSYQYIGELDIWNIQTLVPVCRLLGAAVSALPMSYSPVVTGTTRRERPYSFPGNHSNKKRPTQNNIKASETIKETTQPHDIQFSNYCLAQPTQIVQILQFTNLQHKKYSERQFLNSILSSKKKRCYILFKRCNYKLNLAGLRYQRET